jgi:hypothetical protein
MNAVLRNAFVTEGNLFQSLRDIAHKVGLTQYRIPGTVEKAAVVASKVNELLDACAAAKISGGAPTVVTVANNATDTYTSTIDGFLIMNDFSGAGMVINIDGVAVHTVVANHDVVLKICVGTVVTVVDTADGGTTFKRIVIQRFS